MGKSVVLMSFVFVLFFFSCRRGNSLVSFLSSVSQPAGLRCILRLKEPGSPLREACRQASMRVWTAGHRGGPRGLQTLQGNYRRVNKGFILARGILTYASPLWIQTQTFAHATIVVFQAQFLARLPESHGLICVKSAYIYLLIAQAMLISSTECLASHRHSHTNTHYNVMQCIHYYVNKLYIENSQCESHTHR